MYPETIETNNPDHLHTFALEGGGKAFVLYDNNAESPRKWDINLSRLANVHGGYVQPDGKNADGDLLEVVEALRWMPLLPRLKEILEFDPEKVTDLELGLAQEREDQDFLLCYDYGKRSKVLAVREFEYGSHGEASGVGVIFEHEWLAAGMGQYDAAEHLAMEIQTYVDYVAGKVYGVIIHDAEGSEVEACWGFHGYDYDDPRIVTDNFDAVVVS